MAAFELGPASTGAHSLDDEIAFQLGDRSDREVLDRLIPRLKIAGRCTLADRFLIVRGDRRSYKIHLDSGNILMEPNDQYLCIVPDSRTRPTNEPV